MCDRVPESAHDELRLQNFGLEVGVIREVSYFYQLILCWFLFSLGRSLQVSAGQLDTLHVVLSGQPDGPSKPNGLHTGFSGLPRIAVKGGLSYM